VQLADVERQREYARMAFNMGPLGGTKYRPGHPMRFDERPMTFLPGGQIRVTFTPLAGFPDTQVHSLTQLSTRTVGVVLHGQLVEERIVENLIDGNHQALDKFGLRQKIR